MEGMEGMEGMGGATTPDMFMQSLASTCLNSQQGLRFA